MARKQPRYRQWREAVEGDRKLVDGAVEFCIAFREYRKAVAESNEAGGGGIARVREAQEAMDEAWLRFERRMNKNTTVLVGPQEPEAKSLFGTDGNEVPDGS